MPNVTTPPAPGAPTNATTPPSPTPSPDWLGRNIYIRRLPPVNPATGEMPSEGHVLALFSRFGDIESVRVVRDRNNGLPIGIALVLFRDPNCARLALNAVNASNTGAVANMWLPKGVLYGGAGAI
jgi:RNA recognition motif-containing protein